MSTIERLAGRRLIVEVPATTANLGAGYDCLALALDLMNRTEVEPLPDSDGRIELSVKGEGADELPADRTNPFVVALEEGLRRAGEEIPAGLGWRLKMRNDVPLGRGLGSSAAATVGGLTIANALVGRVLVTAELITIASELEGHADNAAAALMGGFVVVDARRDTPFALRFDVPASLKCVLFIPERRFSTAEMRAGLPEHVTLDAAATNLGRVALGVAGMSQGRLEVLDRLTHDELHEPNRAKLYPEFPAMLEAARDAGALGACLSGAGSTLVAFATMEGMIEGASTAFTTVAAKLGLAGTVKVVGPRNAPARAYEI